jgi:hypothetical protein
MTNELIGAQLISFGKDKFKVKTAKGKVKTFVLDEDEGDCCGYNEVVSTLLISKKELANNPIITDIKETDDEEDDGNRHILTLVGVSKPLAEINSYSSSGSGWCYGACVTLECKETRLSKILSHW